MLDDAPFLSVRNGLQNVCLNKALPDSARQQAAQILGRFASGVRVFILGSQAAEKSFFCNDLLTLRGSDDTSAVTRVFHTSEHMVFPNESVLQSVPARHTRIDPDVLGPVSLIDVHIPSDLTAAEQIYAQVFQEADVVIWCTREFGSDEAEVWARAPDALKDHSFLVLLASEAASQSAFCRERITELQDNAAEEFHSVFVTAIGEDAKHRPVAASASTFASGVPELRRALKRLVVSGRHADIDNAMLFLDRYDSKLTSEKVPEATKETDDKASLPGHPALPYLEARAFDLAEMVFDEAVGDMSDVLHCCVETAEELASLVADEKAGDETMKEWEIAFEDAADKIVLLAAENNTRSAADAITILLQLRRDLVSFPPLKVCA